jgi:phosphate acetyltransferase
MMGIKQEMTFTEKMTEKARKMGKRLVLPESTEPRTLKAARIITDGRISSMVTLIGNPAAVERAAAEAGVSLVGITVVDPGKSPELKSYAEEYYSLRKHKGVTSEEALEKIQDPLLWGAMMVRRNDADAMVAGAQNATAKVLVAGFTIIGTAPGVKSASSCFVMDFPDRTLGKDGLMIFSDCATIPEPTVDQLAEITLASAESCRNFLQTEPVVAMLSFSTKGSASHPLVDKVVNALKIVKEKAPNLNVDGEMQLDTAVVPSVGEKKAPGSPVAGKANTLIFPDLQAGNIGYKIAQRFGNAGAYGPFLQGFAKPISDLSRGASIDDIVNTCAATLTQVI